MKRRIVLRPQVAGDLLDVHTYIAADNPRAADRFLVAVEKTLDKLAEFPGIGSPKRFGGKLSRVRSWAVEGFPNHLIFYKPARGEIVVLAVFHGARDVPRALRPRDP